MLNSINTLAAIIVLYQREFETAIKVGNNKSHMSLEIYHDGIGVEITVKENDTRGDILNNDGTWQHPEFAYLENAIKDIQEENLKCAEIAIENLLASVKNAKKDLDNASEALSSANRLKNDLVNRQSKGSDQ